jgi:hypothetical protein
MTDPTCDWHYIEKPDRLVEFITDPSCDQLSASRASFLYINILGGALAVALVVAGICGVSGAFIPAATILTGLVASDASVYFGSTRKHYDRDCEGER